MTKDVNDTVALNAQDLSGVVTDPFKVGGTDIATDLEGAAKALTYPNTDARDVMNDVLNKYGNK